MSNRALALAGALLIVLAACGSDPEPAPEFGSQVVDGFFTFTIHEFECGALEVSRGTARYAAASEFCLLNVSAGNSGDDSRRFDYEAQYLVDEEDNRFRAHLDASRLINPGLGSMVLQPGQQVTVTIVFDVLNPVAVTEAELHDGIFSEGVTAPVRP